MSTFPPPPPTAARSPLARVRLDDLAPFDGASTPAYARAVDAVAASLTRHGAAAAELPAADAAVVRCALESARGFFRARPGLYVYRAGRYAQPISIRFCSFCSVTSLHWMESCCSSCFPVAPITLRFYYKILVVVVAAAGLLDTVISSITLRNVGMLRCL